MENYEKKLIQFESYRVVSSVFYYLFSLGGAMTMLYLAVIKKSFDSMTSVFAFASIWFIVFVCLSYVKTYFSKRVTKYNISEYKRIYNKIPSINDLKNHRMYHKEDVVYDIIEDLFIWFIVLFHGEIKLRSKWSEDGYLAVFGILFLVTIGLFIKNVITLNIVVVIMGVLVLVFLGVYFYNLKLNPNDPYEVDVKLKKNL